MEVMKCGMYCSLFNVMSKTKQGNSLSGLLHKMEKEKMVSVFYFFIFVIKGIPTFMNVCYTACADTSCTVNVILKFVLVL